MEQVYNASFNYGSNLSYQLALLFEEGGDSGKIGFI